MACCCNSSRNSRSQKIVIAVVSLLAAILYTDQALHYEGRGTAAALTRWMAAAVWSLLACMYLWRVFRSAKSVCGKPDPALSILPPPDSSQDQDPTSRF